MDYVSDESDREKIKHFISLFEVIQPQLDRMRMSVIHGDANEHNILISNDAPAGIFIATDISLTFNQELLILQISSIPIQSVSLLF